MKTIAIAAAASALFVGVPTAHADQYLGLASIGDFQTWCNANAPYPTNAVAVPGPQANGAFQCFPSDRLRSGPVISVNMDAVCAPKLSQRRECVRQAGRSRIPVRLGVLYPLR